MTIIADGIQAAASWETSLHPKKPNGKPITAWERRAATLDATIAETNNLRVELDIAKTEVAEAKKLLEDLRSRPF